MTKIKMTPIRKSAKGKECTLRVSGYGGCSDPETVVFCHAPSSGKGMGKKSPNWWGAFGCQRCHDIIDGRVEKYHRAYMDPQLWRDEINEAWLRGIYETHKILIDEGLIQVAA